MKSACENKQNNLAMVTLINRITSKCFATDRINRIIFSSDTDLLLKPLMHFYSLC